MKGEKKKTFTYASYESVVEKAKKKAFKEGKTVSEKIDEFLKGYVKRERKVKSVDLPTDYVLPEKISVIGQDGIRRSMF